MLRTPQSWRHVTQSFVCWRCIAKSQVVGTFYGKAHRSGVKEPSQQHFSGGRTVSIVCELPWYTKTDGILQIRAGVEAQSTLEPNPEPPPPEIPSTGSSIRDRLRKWELEHAADYVMAQAPKEGTIRKGDVVNSTTRPQLGFFEVEADEEDDFEDAKMATAIFDRGEMVDVGSKRTFLLPGDLVELL